ncbi:C-type lectin domain family 2 member D2-like [Ammospiza maritima maritima]
MPLCRYTRAPRPPALLAPPAVLLSPAVIASSSFLAPPAVISSPSVPAAPAVPAVLAPPARARSAQREEEQDRAVLLAPGTWPGPAQPKNALTVAGGLCRDQFVSVRSGGRHPELRVGSSPGERFRCHPVGTAGLILLPLVLVLALGAALAVLAAPQVPVTPAIPPSLLGCPHDWIGYNGVCYYFSRDYSTWEQGQERCSGLNASLAIAQDEEAMDLLFRLRGNVDFWLGMRRRGERLHWGDGSSYSSR